MPRAKHARQLLAYLLVGILVFASITLLPNTRGEDKNQPPKVQIVWVEGIDINRTGAYQCSSVKILYTSYDTEGALSEIKVASSGGIFRLVCRWRFQMGRK